MSAGLFAFGRIKHGLLHSFAELLAAVPIELGGKAGENGQHILNQLFLEGFRFFPLDYLYVSAEIVQVALQVRKSQSGPAGP